MVDDGSGLSVDPAVERRVLQRGQNAAVAMALEVMFERSLRWCVRAGSALVALAGRLHR